MKPKTRTFATWYEDSTGAEHDIAIEVEADGRSDIAICTELPAMAPDEEQRIKERLSDLYWEAERADYRGDEDPPDPWRE